MIVTQEIDETRQKRRAMRGRVGFVPTLGALHEGHLSLIRRARELADHVMVSIFLNPTQFAPHEDLASYPRTLQRDLELCEREGVELVFQPTERTMYPAEDPAVSVDVPALTGTLEGESRPHFFAGVCRVVLKLLNIVEPELTVFGRKDYQQYRVVEAMVSGLNLPIEVVAAPTVREADGLAMSSRNTYLSESDRRHALGLKKALEEAARLIREGEVEPETVEGAMRRVLEAHHAEVDYAVLREPHALGEIDVIDTVREPVIALVAAKVSGVRLIDNEWIGHGHGE